MGITSGDSVEQRTSGWGLLAALVVGSFIGHVLVLQLLPQVAPRKEHVSNRIDLEIINLPPPPPKPPEPEPPKPEPKPEPPKPKVIVRVDSTKPPPKEPPPPNEEAKEPPKEPVPVVVGLSLSNTAEGGAFAAPVGNTVYGKTDSKAVDPNSVKAYSAPKYAPPGGADSEPSVLGDEVRVPYPEEARQAGTEGTVRLKVTIDEKGLVTAVSILNGPGYGLNEAARDALKRFRFTPATQKGEPVIYTFIYNYTFLLD